MSFLSLIEDRGKGNEREMGIQSQVHMHEYESNEREERMIREATSYLAAHAISEI